MGFGCPLSCDAGEGSGGGGIAMFQSERAKQD